MSRRIISALIVFLLLAFVAVLTAGTSAAEKSKPSLLGGIINTKTQRKEYYIVKADKDVSTGSFSCSMGVSKHYSLEFGLILDAVSICVYSYHYRHTAEVVDTAGRSWVSSDASLVDWALENCFRGAPRRVCCGETQINEATIQ